MRAGKGKAVPVGQLENKYSVSSSAADSKAAVGREVSGDGPHLAVRRTTDGIS